MIKMSIDLDVAINAAVIILTRELQLPVKKEESQIVHEIVDFKEKRTSVL